MRWPPDVIEIIPTAVSQKRVVRRGLSALAHPVALSCLTGQRSSVMAF
jgi:hypothetical protein